MSSSVRYGMTGLAPASYEVSAAVPGFESQVWKNVVLNLGETVIVDFQMKVSGGKEIVEVLAGSPVVDTARGSQAGVVIPGRSTLEHRLYQRAGHCSDSRLDSGI